MCIMMCIIMRAIGYYGATFFQPCFVSFADEQSAIHFVLEDWLITTLLCKCALKDMPMGQCAHCAHCAHCAGHSNAMKLCNFADNDP